MRTAASWLRFPIILCCCASRFAHASARFESDFSFAPNLDIQYPFNASLLIPTQRSPFIAVLGPGRVTMWDLRTGKPSGAMRDPNLALRAISPDGRYVATLAIPGQKRVPVAFEFPSGKRIDLLEVPQLPYDAMFGTVDFPAPGVVAAVGPGQGGSATIVTWDLNTGRRLSVATIPHGLESWCFSPDGRYIASIAPGIEEMLLDIYDLQQQRELVHRSLGEGLRSSQVAFSPDGQELAVVINPKQGGYRFHIVSGTSGGDVQPLRTFKLDQFQNPHVNLHVEGFELPLQWLPDRSGIVYRGRWLIDREGNIQHVIEEVPDQGLTDSSTTPRRVGDRRQLTYVMPQYKGQLIESMHVRVTPIPELAPPPRPATRATTRARSTTKPSTMRATSGTAPGR